MTLVVFEGEKGREGDEVRDFIGGYQKERERWLLITPSGFTTQLRATLVSLEMVDTNGLREGTYYRYEFFKGR